LNQFLILRINLANRRKVEKGDKMAKIRVCLAGGTGWAGSELARGITKTEDLQLVSTISRSHAGSYVGDVIGIPELRVPIFKNVEEAFGIEVDVFVEFTKPDIAKHHALSALANGNHVVIGTSGLDEDDYKAIDDAANTANRGVLAVGNFALTVVLLQKFAEIAAKYIPQWEIIDYASSTKVDVPSGTARELADKLSRVRESHLDIPLDAVQGPPATRGARMQGTQVHSIRLPGYIISLDAVFGMPDQKLLLKHEAGSSAVPYVEGALLAIRKVSELVGLHRGLDSVMEF
jgi:4-hydroxy-tetrahydrodipicolinate reductase